MNPVKVLVLIKHRYFKYLETKRRDERNRLWKAISESLSSKDKIGQK